MTLPLILLAVPSLLIGALVGWPPDRGRSTPGSVRSLSMGARRTPGRRPRWRSSPPKRGGHSLPSAALTYGGFAASIVLSFAGIGLAYLMYGSGRFDPKALTRRFYPLYDLFARKWYVDEIYTAAVVHPIYNERGRAPTRLDKPVVANPQGRSACRSSSGSGSTPHSSMASSTASPT